MAVPVGTNYQKVETVGLITQLDGTGSDPPPSALRDMLKKEMQSHNVRRPDEALASKDTAMVIVRGFIRPGARKGDTFDVEVRIAPRTETTDLSGGWLMQSRMREIEILEGQFHTGHVSALAQGAIVVDALFDRSDDEVLTRRGRVLAGAIVQIDRPMGLVIRDEHTSVKTSSTIGAAINDRFHDFERGTKNGLANPTRDDYIELKVHSRYKGDVSRYIQVIRHIAVGESPVERIARITELEQQLLEPTSSQRAALQLEAIGKDGTAALRNGLTSADPEVRFYAAEALAYLNEPDAIEVLYESARTERAFRWRSLAALGVLDQFAAQEALLQLMNAASAETRYGAFRALQTRDPRDPAIRGELLGSEFALHTISSTGEPMVHLARSLRPEIVLFGLGQQLELSTSSDFVFAGKHILVKRQNGNTVKVTRFIPGGEDQSETCSNDLAEVLRTIVKLGGGYGEVVQALEEAKKQRFLAGRLEIDALPRPGRAYHRDDHEANPTESTSPESIPDIFLDRLKRDTDNAETPRVEEDLNAPVDKERGWLDQATRWMVE